MRVKKILKYRKDFSSRFFKKFVYFNYFFDFAKIKERKNFDFAKQFLALKGRTLTTYQHVLINVFVNERWRFEPFKPWYFLTDEESLLWERMNFYWRFIILDYKKEMLNRTEEKEFGDYRTYFENENAEDVSSLRARAAEERESKNVLYFSDDDIRFSTYIDTDYLKDEFSDMDPLWFPQHDFELERDEVQFIFLEFWMVLFFLFFFFLGPEWIALAYFFYFWDEILYNFEFWEEEDDQEIDDIMIQHCYMHNDEFVEYQFERFQRIHYDEKDLDLLYFLNVEKSKTSGFFFKRINKKHFKRILKL